jgi:hypothetical protein
MQTDDNPSQSRSGSAGAFGAPAFAGRHDPSPKGMSAAGQSGDPVHLAQQLTTAIEDLVRQLDEQEEQRRRLERQLGELQASAQASESLTRTLRDVAGSAISPDDLQKLQGVVQALSQDPNHIMVLASVAQQAGILLQVISNYNQLRSALT